MDDFELSISLSQTHIYYLPLLLSLSLFVFSLVLSLFALVLSLSLSLCLCFSSFSLSLSFSSFSLSLSFSSFFRSLWISFFFVSYHSHTNSDCRPIAAILLKRSLKCKMKMVTLFLRDTPCTIKYLGEFFYRGRHKNTVISSTLTIIHNVTQNAKTASRKKPKLLHTKSTNSITQKA